MAISKVTFEEDEAIKSMASTQEAPSRFKWDESLNGDGSTDSGLRLRSNDGERDIALGDIANTVGNALANLMMSKGEEDVFTPKNRDFVAKVARTVGERFQGNEIGQAERSRLSETDLHRGIERVLIENNAHDVARSLVIDTARNVAQSGEKISVRLIRRNKQVVSWNENKIEIAIRKAFLSQQKDSAPAVLVAQSVTDRVRDAGQAFIHIEEVQDVVQEELMKASHYKVAEAYILYRSQRLLQRADELVTSESEAGPADATQQELLLITQPDGSSLFWKGEDLLERIKYASIDLHLCLSEEQIETELRRSLFSEMSAAELQATILLNAKALMERDADFARFAGRLLCTYIYEEVLDWDILRDGVGALKEAHARYLPEYLRHGVEIKRLSPDLLQYDTGKLVAALDPSADLEFDYLGIQTLYDRYLIVDRTNIGDEERRIETPQLFWMRVAMGLFHNEVDNKEERVVSLYNLYKNRRFCSSTPTLFNSGTPHSQLSSCYLYWVDDSIEGIMERGITENAYLSKWAGGLGGSWTSVRGMGGHIRGTNGRSQGVIPFLKLHNDLLVAVNQGGKRRGSGCAYLETWHNDIGEFLELRKNTGDDRRRTHDMNTANWVPDLFMKRMEARENWTLFCSSDAPDLHETYGRDFEERYLAYEAKAERGEMSGEKISAIDLWKRMLQMIFETGHPWITFKDACNVRSPQDHAGVIHSSNLCTEITLNTGSDETAVCNLGSVVLDNHLTESGELDLAKLRETIRIAVRALDNVIDINFYPTQPARNANLRHRPIGLGVMGLQNTLYQKGVSFASEAAVEFNDEFMEAIAYFAYEASSDLAKEKGRYESYEGSKWDRGLLPPDTVDLLEQERGQAVDVPRGGRMDWEPIRQKIASQGMRNSNVLAIAPTATISNIMGTSPCIEPLYKNLYVKSNLSGDFIVLNRHLVHALKSRGLWNEDVMNKLKYLDGDLHDIAEVPNELKELFATAFDVDPMLMIAAAARRQKWIDQSQSVNLFLAKPDMKRLSHMYRAAWRSGLKTTYYLRTLGASNIEKATIAVKKQGVELPEKEHTAEERLACSIEAMRNGEECEACQ
ncbi:MAG: ribonucleoside-diphosphate reductase subunit alpha [Verrucomicrobiota bacterium]